MPEISEEDWKEFRRLKAIGKSVLTGLREEGFSGKAFELFKYRKNFLTRDPDDYSVEVVGSFPGDRGDRVDIFLRIENAIIKDARYRTDGCPGAVISASALTDWVIGRDLEKVSSLNVSSILNYLKEGSKGLPEHMHDCCGIAVGSLKDALEKVI